MWSKDVSQRKYKWIQLAAHKLMAYKNLQTGFCRTVQSNESIFRGPGNSSFRGYIRSTVYRQRAGFDLGTDSLHTSRDTKKASKGVN